MLTIHKHQVFQSPRPALAFIPMRGQASLCHGLCSHAQLTAQTKLTGQTQLTDKRGSQAKHKNLI